MKKVVIDAGHGGSDPGASGNDIVEKDYTLKISNYIFDRLKELGVDASITRNSDISLSPSDRTKIIKNFYGSGNDVVVVSNHINAGGGKGAEIIYSLRNNDNLSKKLVTSLESAGQTVRKYYQRRLPSNPALDYYFVLRDTANNESIIIEYGFLDNVDDANTIKNDWKKLAEAVVSVIAEYVGVNYVPVNNSNSIVVKKGDTLWSIAKKYNTTVNDLKLVNNLVSNSLSIGQILYLPSSETSVTDADNMKKYIVKKGDTLYGIAKANNINVDTLKQLNDLPSDFISVGQVLFVSPENKKDDKTNIYTVKSGDNLYAISKMYGVSVDDLKNENNLSSNLLSIGQKLKIPTKSSDNIYTVVAGDTLYSIARKFNTTVSDIQNKNSLSTSNLFVGQKLII